MLLTNAEMKSYLDILNKYPNAENMLGYAIARNIRALEAATIEYDEAYNRLVKKYGSAEIGDNGEKTGRFGLSVSSPEFKKFKAELLPYSIIKHEVKITKAPYAETIGVLKTSEILELDWMLEDSDIPVEQ